MRLALMGSTIPSVAVAAPDEPRAFFAQIGTRFDQPAGFGHPFQFTDDGICEVWYRISEIEIAYSLGATFGTPGDMHDVTASFSGTLENSADEEGRMIVGLAQNGAPTWDTSPISGTVTESINGGAPVTTHPLFEPILRISTPESIQGNPFVPYYWKTGSLWLPSFEFWMDLASAILPSQSSLETLTGGIVSTQSGTYRGNPFNLSVKADNSMTDFVVTSYTLTLTPSRWLEYRRSNGTEPIWDQSTGAELRNHSTTQT